MASRPRLPLVLSCALALGIGLVCPRPTVAAPAVAAPAVAAPTTGTLRLQTGSRGAAVLIDGVQAGQAPLPGPWTLPVGSHTVELRPKSGPAVKSTFAITAGKEAVIELLPVDTSADDEPEFGTAAQQRVIYAGPGFSLATAGFLTAGVGVASGALAVLFGLQAKSKAEDADKLDKSDPTLTRADQRKLVDDSDRAALLCNVTMGLGAVAAASGVAMILLASDGPLGHVSLTPTPGGAALGGRF